MNSSASSRRGGIWILAGILLTSIATGSAPSPLYPLYSAEWHLTPLLTTTVFAVYVGGLLITLLTAGALSDYIGRKPLIAIGLAGLLIAMGFFMFANGPGTLILARIVQGGSVGLMMGTLGAAMLDNAPRGNTALAATLNGSVPPVGLAFGAIVSGVLTRFAPNPAFTVYASFTILLIALAVALIWVPETVTRRPGGLASLRPTLAIPAASRSLFGALAGAFAASWGLGGLFLAMLPSILIARFGLTDHLLPGLLIGLFTLIGAATGVVTRGMNPRHALLAGLAGLIAGSILVVIAVDIESFALLIIASIVGGIGFGAGFQAPLRMLTATAEPQHRAGLLSAIYVVSYLSFGVPVLIAGALEPVLGLATVATLYGLVMAASALIALIAQLTSRRDRRLEREAERAEHNPHPETGPIAPAA
ncbi:MFS family permease [Mycetocola sp. BIGb0189]|uniref:MFS transporter n=1 Tax=Mycetocola sp. BIGb0189 TaxID=2940604 RepID=UPI0021698AA5|nr:MFS transporter [Mycetocola sp. BIGb0189]MCS4277053.1 MFS family permease [Mycetocola sp. BIGb0189]